MTSQTTKTFFALSRSIGHAGKRIRPVNAVLLSTLLALSACGKNDDSPPAAPTVNNDEASLAPRLEATNENIPLVEVPGQALTGLIPGIETFTAVNVANLTPPTVGGLVVQANDVLVDGLLTAYVAYNYAGEPYAGAIDLLDITSVLSLKLLSSLPLPNTDINGITKSGTNLYAVGASSLGTSPAFLDKIALSGNLLTSTISQVALPSYAGTDVAVSGANVYATSGDGGGLSVFDTATLTLSKYTPIADARSVGFTTAGIPKVLSGQPGKINTMTAAGDLTSSVTVNGNATAQSKSNVSVGSKWTLSTLGEGGFIITCNADGSQIAKIPAVTVSGLAAAKTVTNSAVAYNGLIYTANGEAGVYVYSVKDATTTGCGTATVTALGTLNFGTGFSANGVYSNGALLFVATGLGGLKILTTVYVGTVALTSNL